ncbi:hypothetical protein Pflav_010230 [Phytohabitans flavus]|uniref:Uncharacterized protein n=1 Tax=Phytohabitans flavus TaxID=1076124 RepID=A0A6F8XLC8_9ACTN|nr:hypothetical protein Pflav_010230 [Phytohabitans flavus]
MRPNSLSPVPAPATAEVVPLEVAVDDTAKLARVVERKVEPKGPGRS